jgi:hypothetical protein
MYQLRLFCVLLLLPGCSEDETSVSDGFLGDGPTLDSSTASGDAAPAGDGALAIDASPPRPDFALPAGAWQSKIVFHDKTGTLVYKSDADGNRIPDFSHAGYGGGGVPLPKAPVKKTVKPGSGDDGAAIQAALDAVAELPLQNGLRGAVLLEKGEYQLKGTLYIKASGVVLRGAGNGSSKSDTVIRRTGTGTDPVIVVGGGSSTKWKGQVSGTKTNITSKLVKVGERSFEVADASKLKVGDNIVIHHPCTDKWIKAVKAGGLPEIGNEAWKVDELPIVYNRFIEKIQGDTVTVDAPVFAHLDASLSQSYVYKYDRKGLVENVGLESLRVLIDTKGSSSEDHSHHAIQYVRVEDAWASKVTVIHYAYSGFRLSTATRVTLESCEALDPHSVVTGMRRYSFHMGGAQLVLVRDCLATSARHPFVTNGTTYDSGNVYLNCTSKGLLSDDGPHRRWATGILWDGIVQTDLKRSRAFAVENRSDWGTGHGWAGSNCVVWNYKAGTYQGKKGQVVVQRPPLGQNYAIGCDGAVDGKGKHDLPAGHIEGTSKPNLFPPSLYLEQLKQRLP